MHFLDTLFSKTQLFLYFFGGKPVFLAFDMFYNMLIFCNAVI